MLNRTPDQLRTRGLELLQQLHGEHVGEAIVSEMQLICPDFAEMTIQWSIGSIMDRPGLDLATRELILIAACVTRGDATEQLVAHTEAALRVGATKVQVIETILQLTFYAGGPAVRNAFVAVKNLLI